MSKSLAVKARGQLPLDSRGQHIQRPNGFTGKDAYRSVGLVSIEVATNVATIVTAAVHGFQVGMFVKITATGTGFDMATADAVIASTPTTASFTVAYTHANTLAPVALAGTAEAHWVSPIPTSTDEAAIVWPDNAVGLTVKPLTANTGLLEVTGGTAIYTMASGLDFPIPGQPTDTTYIYRTAGTTALEFAFDILR